ncbi:MAG: glycosyltransferase family 4 protein, partial [Gemmataceae bacterium]|nr:glycosyltransferase family 4 protein [Gemmataceae bacterium]
APVPGGTERGRAVVRVVVNQLAALGLRTGIGHYTMELLRCLRDQTIVPEIHSFPEGWVRRVREWCAQVRPHLEGIGPGRPGHGSARPPRMALRSEALRSLRQLGRTLLAEHFRRVCARRGYDLYHEPNFIPLPCDCPTLATVHDLSVLLHPEWHPADRVAHFERHFERGLKQCVHILAISEFGRQEVIRTLNLPPERVTCTYMGIRRGLGPLPATHVAGVLRQLGLPPRYLLYLGTLEPRKNILTLLHAYCALPARLRSQWPLLLVGSWGWNTADLADYLQSEARHRGVIHVGYVAEEHLAVIYNGARALVYPSLYEGFGLPPVEMMACGGAVLASTAGALVETVGGQAHLVQPHDVLGWRDGMVRALEDEDWWQSLRQGAVAAARPYTWARCAADTLRVYRALCPQTTDRHGTGAPALPERRRAAG